MTPSIVIATTATASDWRVANPPTAAVKAATYATGWYVSNA